MTTWYLFVDDERQPADAGWTMDGVVIARSSSEALDIVQSLGIPDQISFDHDLGGSDTAFKFMVALIDGHLDGLWDLDMMTSVQVHSANPIGAEKLISLWQGFCASEQLDVPVKRVWPRSGA
jgi:hypothetical protein